MLRLYLWLRVRLSCEGACDVISTISKRKIHVGNDASRSWTAEMQSIAGKIPIVDAAICELKVCVVVYK